MFDLKITPGPWGIHRGSAGLILDERNDHIAIVERLQEEWKANSMAIVAVPKLLKVCKAARCVLDEFYDGRREHSGDPFIDKMESLQKAIRLLEERHGN